MKPTKREGKFDRKPTPVDRLMANLDGTYYRISEVAKMLDKSSHTVRRTIGKPGIHAPSYQVKQGGLEIYLYTPEDVEELREHFSG